jgi:DNA-directed RNA polymerase subunit M/transcription elongation factor TFIIS
MHFCSNCGNMYYIRLDEDAPDTLVYYCRNCNHESDTPEALNICVSKTQIKQSQKNFTHIVNKYTKLDPTLPRINTVMCPNDTCPTNKADNPDPREIIYIRYDDTNMKYIYLCSNELCNYKWKASKHDI